MLCTDWSRSATKSKATAYTKGTTNEADMRTSMHGRDLTSCSRVLYRGSPLHVTIINPAWDNAVCEAYIDCTTQAFAVRQQQGHQTTAWYVRRNYADSAKCQCRLCMPRRYAGESACCNKISTESNSWGRIPTEKIYRMLICVALLAYIIRRISSCQECTHNSLTTVMRNWECLCTAECI